MVRTPQYDAFFVPEEVDPDEAIALGIRWLLQQPGEPLILLHAKNMIDNNPLLGAAARRYGIAFEAPGTLWGKGLKTGAVLAAWASDKVLRCIDDRLAFRAQAVCVIGWRPNDPNHAAWISARGARDLRDDSPLGTPVEEIVTDPVVRIALDEAERFVNHNNMLVQAEDKSYLIRTFQELVRGGHGLNLDQITTYAMATGWTSEEVKRMREYGERILQGRSFRLKSTIGPEAGAVKRWEAEAEQ
jgi:hypothetical protein